MTVLCYPLAAPLLTSKRRSTVEPGTCEESLRFQSHRLTRLQATDVYGV